MLNNLFGENWEQEFEEQKKKMTPEEREESEKRIADNIEMIRNLPTAKELGFDSEEEKNAYKFAVRTLLFNDDWGLTVEEKSIINSLETKEDLSYIIKEFNLEFMVRRYLSMDERERIELHLYLNEVKLNKYLKLYDEAECKFKTAMEEIKKNGKK